MRNIINLSIKGLILFSAWMVFPYVVQFSSGAAVILSTMVIGILYFFLSIIVGIILCVLFAIRESSIPHELCLTTHENLLMVEYAIALALFVRPFCLYLTTVIMGDNFNINGALAYFLLAIAMQIFSVRPRSKKETVYFG